MRQDHQKMRLQIFNKYDLERTMRNTLEDVQNTNEKIYSVLQEQDALSDSSKEFFYISYLNNSAEIVRLSSAILHKDDIYNYLAGGPLLRGEE